MMSFWNKNDVKNILLNFNLFQIYYAPPCRALIFKFLRWEARRNIFWNFFWTNKWVCYICWLIPKVVLCVQDNDHPEPDRNNNNQCALNQTNKREEPHANNIFIYFALFYLWFPFITLFCAKKCKLFFNFLNC